MNPSLKVVHSTNKYSHLRVVHLPVGGLRTVYLVEPMGKICMLLWSVRQLFTSRQIDFRIPYAVSYNNCQKILWSRWWNDEQNSIQTWGWPSNCSHQRQFPYSAALSDSSRFQNCFTFVVQHLSKIKCFYDYNYCYPQQSESLYQFKNFTRLTQY